jgi:hypothetical protein
MVLFPLALLWIIGVIVWIVRNNLDGSPGERERSWRRWRPRPPRRPWSTAPSSPARRAGGAARASAPERREHSAR